LFAKNNLSRLPEGLKKVYPKYKYPVAISPGLRKLRKDLTRQLRDRQ
jgi:hypothetical protein